MMVMQPARMEQPKVMAPPQANSIDSKNGPVVRVPDFPIQQLTTIFTGLQAVCYDKKGEVSDSGSVAEMS